MKKIAFYVMCVMVAISATSCRYEEGPFISFKSAEERIVGYWRLSEVEKNGTKIDSTDVIPNNPGNYYAFFIERMLSVTALDEGLWRESDYGTWDFQNKNKELYVNFMLKNKRYEYTAVIKRLTSRELVYEFYDKNGDKWRFSFNSR